MTARGSPPPPAGLGAFVRRRPMFVLFLVAWTAVHAGFEYNFWVRGEATVFTKYAAAEGAPALLELAEKVYYTKATWMFAFVWLLVLRVPLTTAMAWSFLLYSAQLLLFFPFRVYSALNLALAVGMVAEVFIRRRWERAA